MVLLTGCFLALFFQDGGPPDLKHIFLNHDRTAFRKMLSETVRVKTDLRPVLYDQGYLSRQQVLMGFDKLFSRYRVHDAAITNSQSDTNYSWLEIYVSATLEDKETTQIYEVTFAFHFKIAVSRMAISRWVLQDIH